MYITNKEVLKKIPCYVMGEKLAQYLIMKKKIPVLSIQNGEYYFRKNSLTDGIFAGGKFFKGEIPFNYRFLKVETRGGEEN